MTKIAESEGRVVSAQRESKESKGPKGPKGYIRIGGKVIRNGGDGCVIYRGDPVTAQKICNRMNRRYSEVRRQARFRLRSKVFRKDGTMGTIRLYSIQEDVLSR